MGPEWNWGHKGIIAINYGGDGGLDSVGLKMYFETQTDKICWWVGCGVQIKMGIEADPKAFDLSNRVYDEAF